MYLAEFEPAVITYVLALVGMIFVFVLIHELAHVATARFYGVPTREITLHPLGGVSMLERVPQRPGQEALVGFAGPFVNIVLAVLFFPLALHLHGWQAFLQFPDLLEPGTWALDLFWINVLLGVFNLLPAFPLDGGRILRATLAVRISYANATRIAAFVGRTLAIAFAVIGFMLANWLLIIIGVFVFFGAAMEERSAQLMRLFARMNVQDAMRTDLPTVHPHDSLEQVVAMREPPTTSAPTTSTTTTTTPTPRPIAVVSGDRLHGLIDAETLRYLQPRRDLNAESVMTTNIPTITPEEDLSNALRQFAGSHHEAIGVVADDDPQNDPGHPRFIGLLTTQEMEAAYQHLRREALAERAQKRRRRRGGPPPVTQARIHRGEAPTDAEEWVPEGTKP